MATRYDLAFISYASADRLEVLRRIQVLSAVGIRYFQDLLNLEPGDAWRDVIFRHIDESNVMFLFWSTRARDSDWVEMEWRYALKTKTDPQYIRPVIIEGPPPIPPPLDLAYLHFNDKILYIMKAC
jgi:hypothetical protein